LEEAFKVLTIDDEDGLTAISLQKLFGVPNKTIKKEDWQKKVLPGDN